MMAIICSVDGVPIDVAVVNDDYDLKTALVLDAGAFDHVDVVTVTPIEELLEYARAEAQAQEEIK